MSGPKSTRTFEEASAEIRAGLQKHIAVYDQRRASSFSDESEDSDEDEAVQKFSSDQVLDKVFGSRRLEGGQRTEQAIKDTFTKGASSCLICIATVKKQDAIWNCENCFCSFHLTCIQRWSRDSIFQQRNDRENQIPDLSSPQTSSLTPLQWGCPKCRHAHSPEQIPVRYTCFCGKVSDPPFDPWIVPHSCDDVCGKKLKPECGHHCLILCHPGPCPPCPQMVTSACHCNQSAPATRRCFDRNWSCSKPCNRRLSCGQHLCPTPCHEGACKPCAKVSVQLCRCQRKQQQRRCAEPDWQCDEKCGRPLACGHHVCDIVCHEGECPPCPLSEVRRCPCGKSRHILPCTLATPTCGDTCGKTLSCGQHICAERCHRGACSSCLQMVIKRCRCEAKKKEVPCTKVYTCDTKCKRLRDCRKHACNRKCCEGDCRPCEQACGKSLSCKNHKCQSRCHQGNCYPCNEVKEVTCNCSASRILVPCGLEKVTPSPRCRQRCSRASECHHPEREPHRCHFNGCPPCKQVCGKQLKCKHNCSKPCHDKVTVTLHSGLKASTPWEETAPRQEIQTLNCPPCEVPVPVTCSGGHETAEWPCHTAKVGSCGRKCGRRLGCQNHQCSRECHRVKGAVDDVSAGVNCRKCELECQKKRPEGCSHLCQRPCHPGECDECKQMTRILCHCGLSQLYVKCGEWTAARGDDRDRLSCCQNQCPKLMNCGHRCTKLCHSGDCSNSANCRKKVKLFCPCRRRKEERPCPTKNESAIACDEGCEQAKAKAQEALHQESRRIREEAERLEQEELKRFEKAQEGRRKRGGRDRRNRRGCEPTEKPFWRKNCYAMAAAALVAVAATTLTIGYSRLLPK